MKEVLTVVVDGTTCHSTLSKEAMHGLAASGDDSEALGTFPRQP